jgi:multiple sugar transport system permease protein
MSGRHGTRLRARAGLVGTYLLLAGIAVIFLFPFVFMISTSLKTSQEVFRVPPQLFPLESATATFEGQELPLYRIPTASGTFEMVPVETGVRAGVLVDPEDPGDPLLLPLDAFAPVLAADGAEATVLLDGEPVPLVEVTGEDGPTRLALARTTSVARLVDPAEPTRQGFAVLRTAEAVERITAHPENFSDVLERSGFDRSLTNTILVTLAVVIGQLFTSIIGGYAFARIPFPFRNALFLVYLGSIMIPFVVLIIPLYQLMVGIGWVDRVPALIFPWIFTAYGTFLMRQFFITVPKELEEAALIDGASRLEILRRIFLPASIPAIATQATFTFLYAWNSFVWPLLVINTGNEQNHVLTLSLMILRGRATDAPNLILAGAAIAVIPPLLVFIFAQRFYIESVTSSGVKG